MAPEGGEVLVTGAGSGVSSIDGASGAPRCQVAAMTGRPEIGDYLSELGAARIVGRAEVAEDPGKVMESAIWAVASTVSAARSWRG